MRIHITYTGGTIGMVESPNGLVPGADMRGWLRRLIEDAHLDPSLFSLTELDPLIDSSNATPDNWQTMAMAEFGGQSDYIMTIGANFICNGRKVPCRILLSPDVRSLNFLLKRLGVLDEG